MEIHEEHLEQHMEIPVSTKLSFNNLWLVILITILSCLVLFSFDFSALTQVTDYGTPISTQEVDKGENSCLGKYIYVHHLPHRFNQELFAHCELITRGAPRPDLVDSVRGKIIEECQASSNLYKLLNCNYGATNYDNPVNVMKLFQNTIFEHEEVETRFSAYNQLEISIKTKIDAMKMWFTPKCILCCTL